MNSEELFQASGLSGVIDTSLPQSLFDEILNVLGFNPLGHFVYWYPARDDPEFQDTKSARGTMDGGRLLSVSRLYAEAEKNGRLLLQHKDHAYIKRQHGKDNHNEHK